MVPVAEAGGGWPRETRVPLWCWDVGLAVVVAVVGLLPTGHMPRWGYPAAFCGGLALVARRRWPRLVLFASFPALIGGLGTMAAGSALYALGRARPGYRALWPWIALAMVMTMAPVVYNTVRHGYPPLTWGDWVVTVLAGLLITAGPAAGGALAATRMRLAESLAVLRATEADRDAAVAAKVRAEERNRLAREVHDIVGHYAALIAVQASALEVHTEDPRTKDTAVKLRELSSDALEEMRTAIALWGRAGAGPASPQDWVPWVLQPAAAARMSGVTLHVHSGEGLPDAVADAVLRVLRRAVQEGVTNAVRHSPGAPVTVVLRIVDAEECVVRVEVSNPLAAETPAAADPGRGGSGLTGLRERVSRLGGSFSAAPTHSGDWLLAVEVRCD